MGVGLESLGIHGAHVHVVDTGDLQLEALVAVGLEAVQLVEDIRALVSEFREKLSINRELEFGLGERDGQFELLVDDEGESAVTLLSAPTKKGEMLLKSNSSWLWK